MVLRYRQRLAIGMHKYIQKLILFVMTIILFTPCSKNGFCFSGPVQSFLTASADSAISLGINPAGIANHKQKELVGKFVFFSSTSTFETTADSFTGKQSSDSDGNIFIPFVFYAQPLTDKLVFGSSFTAPGGFGSDFDDSAPSRYLVDDWSTGYISVALALAYKINTKWAVGGGIMFNYSIFNYESAVYNGIGENDGRMKLEADAFSLSFQFGLLYEFSSHTRLGFGYRSKNESTLEDTPNFTGLTASRQNLLDNAGYLNREISIDMAFPDMASIGFWHDFGNGFQFEWDLLWINFSEFGLTQLSVGERSISKEYEHYQDGYGSSLGFAYTINEDLRVKTGVLYISEMTDNDRSFMLRLDRIWGVGMGFEYNIYLNWLLGVNLNYYNLGPAPTSKNVPLLGKVAGEYTSNDTIGLDFTLRWRL
jgi:long-chain fatty acid transport protein